MNIDENEIARLVKSVLSQLETNSSGASKPAGAIPQKARVAVLTKPEHFEKMRGRAIQVKLIRPLEGQREFSGTLESFENGIITFVGADENKISINKKDTAYVRLDDFGGVEQ